MSAVERTPVKNKSLSLRTLEALEPLPLARWSQVERRVEFEDHQEYMTAEVVDGFEISILFPQVNFKVILEKLTPVTPGRVQFLSPYRLRIARLGEEFYATIPVEDDGKSMAEALYENLMEVRVDRTLARAEASAINEDLLSALEGNQPQ